MCMEAMRMLANASLLLLMAFVLSQSPGLKGGIQEADLRSKKTAMESEFFSRIISWRNSTVGGHLWQVSLKLGEHQFGGRSLIQDDWIVTAAHCLRSLNEKQLQNLTVTAGEYNLFQKEKQEQNIPVSKIIIHPEYNRLGYRSSDIELLSLKHKVKFGIAAQPVCLPHRTDKFEAEILCLASGWSKISKTSGYSNALQEVELPIMDDRMCSTVLRDRKLPPLEMTMLCAGFRDGGPEACQRDSGGPLVCRRDGGTWTLAGIASWVAGCASGSTPIRKKHRRALAGIFSKVLELMDFITQNIITDLDWGQSLSKVSPKLVLKALSSGQGMDGSQREDHKPHGRVLFGKSGKIPYPYSKEGNCSHNWCCPVGVLLIVILCTTGKVCGDILPSPLPADTSEATVTSVSRAENSGSGLELTFTAIQNSEAGLGCGNVTVLAEEGTIYAIHYPRLYLSNVWCHWFIHAPERHIIKLTFEDFNGEFNQHCIHDAVVIYDDIEEEPELAKLCGILYPTPVSVFSSSNMMMIHFKHHSENNFQDFKARVTFLPSDSLNKFEPMSPPQTNPVSTAKSIQYEVCGIPPFSPQWLSRRIAGGEEACPHCWPWQVGLRFLGNHQCGGAIITPRWILTAAHCVQSTNNPLSWTIVAGDHDRTLKESTEQVRRAKHIIVHEDFDILSYDSDIALIQLSSPLQYNLAVRPVCLPHNTEPLFSSEICVVTGWGSTSEDGVLAKHLQQIQVPVIERAVCERTYYSAHPGGITDKMMCAGFAASGGKDFCQGDSGGPLVCRYENGPFVLYGIVSWGAGCVQPWKPGVFARVSVFLDWIQSKIKGPSLLQIKNRSKTLTKQLSLPIPSMDSASGPGPKNNKITKLVQSSNQVHMITCEDVLTNPEGIRQISTYPHRMIISCHWRSIAPLIHIIRLDIIKFQVKPILLACYSHLWVYERFGPGKNLIGRLLPELIKRPVAKPLSLLFLGFTLLSQKYFATAIQKLTVS